MPIDPSISLGYKAPVLRDPLEQYSNVLAIQNAQRQGQLGDLQYQNALRAQADDQATRQAIMGANGDYGQAVNALLSKGLYQPAGAIAKQQQELAQSKATMDRAKAATMKDNLDYYATRMASLANNPSPEAISAVVQDLNGKGIPLHAPIPPVVNPDAGQQWVRSGAAMSAQGLRAIEAFLPKAEKVDQGGSISFVNTNPLAGTVGTSIAGSPTIAKTPTIAEKEAARHNPVMEGLAGINARTAQGNLSVNRQRLENDLNPNVVANSVTDAAGNVTQFNKFGQVVGKPGAIGKPSATFEKTQQQRRQLLQDLDRTIPELEEAVKKDGLIDKSTGSGAGAAIDWAASVVGMAPEGAIAVGRLKPIYDMVLKMVPRFEGPQSDKDTKAYQDAAGQIANPSIPNSIKKDAAKEILRLMKARKDQFLTRDIVDGGGGATPIKAPAGWKVEVEK